MSDQQSDPHAEAYHTLAALRFQQDQAKQALEQQIGEIAKQGQELTKQLEEAEGLNDGEAVQRIEAAIEELHQAYVVAKDELDRHEPDGEPDATGGGDELEPDESSEEDDHQSAPTQDRSDAGRPPSASETAAEPDTGEEPESAAEEPPASGEGDTGEADATEESEQAPPRSGAGALGRLRKRLSRGA